MAAPDPSKFRPRVYVRERRHFTLSASAAAISVSAQDIAFKTGSVLPIDAASINAAGQAVSPLVSRILAPEVATINAAGQDVSLIRRILAVDPGLLNAAGQDVSLIRRILAVDPGLLNAAGQDVSLIRRVLPVDAAAVNAAGQSVSALVSRVVTIDAASINAAGQDVTINTGVDYTYHNTEENSTTASTWTTTTAWTTSGVTLVGIAATSDDPADSVVTAVTGDPGGADLAFTKFHNIIRTAGVGRHPSLEIWAYNGALSSDTIKVEWSDDTTRKEITVLSLSGVNTFAAEDIGSGEADASSVTMSDLASVSAGGLAFVGGNCVGNATFDTTDLDTQLAAGSPGSLTYSWYIQKGYDGSNVTFNRASGSNHGVVCGVTIR